LSRIVIVGGGQAGGQAAARLRQNGYEGDILLIGEEALPPYQRPPLSKQYLAGEMPIERVLLRPEAFYADKSISLKLGTRVLGIECAEKHITLESGETIDYDKLLLATGGRARKLPLPGADHAAVHYLRDISDVDAIRAKVSKGARLVIVGGGYIGLEVASVGAKLGVQVTVLEMEPRVLARVTSKRMSAYYESLHRERGVNIVTRAHASAFQDCGSGGVRVECADGQSFDADIAIIGAGIVPNVELAQAAGLDCDNGIVVDSRCQTSDANIYAAGDCTNHPNALLGRRLRLESVPNAMEQARVAVENLCGTDCEYAALPWFWSDQYELKLQMAGFSAGADEEVVRGEIASNAFAVFYLKSGRIIAVESINSAREFMAARKLIESGKTVDAKQLADVDTPLRSLL